MKKSTFLSKISFFFHKINIFAPKLILTETLVTLPQSLRHYFITVLGNSLICPKTDAFCIKCYCYNAIKNWHFSKTEDTSLRKLNISFKNEHFWKWWPLSTKMKKILQNWCFCKIFDFTYEAHITKKLTLLKQIAIFFRNDN